MITLTGSEKQTVWAEQIRSKIAPEIAAGIANLEANRTKLDEVGIATLDLLQRITNQSSAAWWIDYRQMLISLRNLMSEVGGGTKTKPECAAKINEFCK